MKVKPIKIKIKEPTPSAADRLYAKHQAIRKASGLPDPSEYKKRIVQKQAEIDALKKEESEVHEQLEKKGRFVSGPAKKPFQSNTIVSPMKEAKDAREYDYEGDMATSQLRSLIFNAEDLIEMMDDNTNLPEWVQSKITLAEDYISTAANYLRGELTEEVKPPTGDLKDACWKGYTAVGMKMKNGRKVPNCVPVKEETDEPSMAARTLSRKAQIVKAAAKGKKEEREEASDKFQKDPELSSDIQKT